MLTYSQLADSKMKKRKQTLESAAPEPAPKKPRSGTIAKSTGNNSQKTRRKASPPPKVNDAEDDMDVESPLSSELSHGEHSDGAEEVASEEDDSEPIEAHTPAKKTPGGLKNGTGQLHSKIATPTRGLLNKKLFATPVKTNETPTKNDTPRIERNADRSARRKSTRTLIERTILGNTSDNEEDEDNIAQHIYGSENEEEEVDDSAEQLPEEAQTPSKRGRPAGKSKVTKDKKRSPSPPQDLESHEKYFFHNRGGRAKTSNNDLSSLALLDHEEYFSRSRQIADSHEEDIKFLEGLHADSFNQWLFELSQGFNICAFGYGSKRALLMRFADHVYQSQSHTSTEKIVIINGYVNNLTVRDVLSTVALAIAERGQKLGSQPTDMLENVIALLEVDKTQRVTLIIHSIDRMPLRRATTQTILSRLGAHPQVRLVASADHPSFPLFWDSSLRSTYNFLFHDCTTFQPYSAETDVVDEVHELLGRSGRRVGGKEGVSFVLKSLPENAKNLFKILIGEQLAAADGNSAEAGDEEDYNDENGQKTANTRKGIAGVEYRVLYQKAVEEFICSNEMSFRTLMKE